MTSHVALHVLEHLTHFNWNNQRLMLACTWYNASCCICMYLPVCVVYYDFVLFSFTDVVYSVNYYFSIQHFCQVGIDVNNIGFCTIHSFCLASGVVDLNINCLAFNVDGNISALVTVNLIIEVWERKYLSGQLLLMVRRKALISLV